MPPLWGRRRRRKRAGGGGGGSSEQIEVTSLYIVCSVVLFCLRGGGVADECQCDKYDFVSAKALNQEGLLRFTQDHNVLSDLNNRLVRLIELVKLGT